VAAKAVAFARQNQFRIIHVGLGFSEGHPEIPDSESPFLRIKQNNLFVKGTPSVELHGDIFHPEDLVIYKQRVGRFRTTILNWSFGPAASMLIRCSVGTFWLAAA
jgi:hypothetical protein